MQSILSNRKFDIIIFTLALLAFTRVHGQEFSFGVDLSYVNELEDCGAFYYDSDGTPADPYELLAQKGANMVRLRLWHNPQWTSYCNFEDVKESMHRASAAGMKIMLDFHYSDFWADPSRQWRPEAWNAIDNDEVLADSLYNYTYNTLRKLVALELAPDIVQIGNETNGNILIKRNNENLDGSSPNMYPLNWSRQVALLNRAITAVHEVNTEFGTSIRTLVHVAQPDNASWWFSDATNAGLEGYDIIGISYYPQWSEFDIRRAAEKISDLVTEYGKEVMIVETGYPWTFDNADGNPNRLGWGSRMDIYNREVSLDVQRKFLTELTWLTMENGGSGIIYWEPAWVASGCFTYWGSGSSYDNAALFDFDHRLHAGADYLSYDYSVMPEALNDQEAIFRVNMSDRDTQNGVFVTGDFTGDEWQFINMSQESSDWYFYETAIPGRSEGAFIFYNDDSWNIASREIVPEACAAYWNSHRKYVITDQAARFEFAWGSCDTLPVGLTEGHSVNDIFYIPEQNIIILGNSSGPVNLWIVNLAGQCITKRVHYNDILDVTSLTPGIYILRVESGPAVRHFKFSKQ